MNKEKFFLIIADHDKHQFTVEGPMYDDRPWNIRVVAAQRQGRDITCSGEHTGPLHMLIKGSQRLVGYRYINHSIL